MATEPTLRSMARGGWPALVVAAALLLPFLHKAHTIDDVTFLLQAQHVLADPLHPTAFHVVSEGTRVRVSEGLATGPVMAFLLVPSVLLGGAEWASHLVQLGFIGLGIAGTVGLGLRMGLTASAARMAALLVVTTPAVLAMATTSMPDVPAMAFGVVGLERLYAWKATARWVHGVSTSVALTLAALSRPHLVLLVAVAAVALLPTAEAGTAQTWRLVPRRLWLPLGITPLVLWIITRLTADPGAPGANLAAATLTRFTWQFAGPNALAFAVHWVLVVPLALPWVWLRWRPVLLSRIFWAALPAAAAVLVARHQWRWILWIPPLAALGVAVLADVLRDGWRRRDHAQLVLGLWLFLALPAVAYVQMPSKYLVPSAPAVGLLVARALDPIALARRRVIAGVTLVAGTVLALLIIQADARFAELGRQAARELIAPQIARGARVWSDGDWGFQWYAMRAGARPLTHQPPYPERGDVVVTSGGTPGARMHWLRSRRLLGSIADTTPGGRVMSVQDGAGFYSNHHGYLPWAWGRGDVERINAWEILD